MDYLAIFIFGLIFGRWFTDWFDVLTNIINNKSQLFAAKIQQKINNSLTSSQEDEKTNTNAIGFHMNTDEEFLDDFEEDDD